MKFGLKAFLLVMLTLGFPFVKDCPADPPTIRLVHAPHDHHAPLYVAAMLPDLFRREGGVYLKEIVFRKQYELIDGSRPIAKVTIDSSTGGSELIRKLAEDQYDVALGGFPAMVQIIDDGYPIRIVAPLMTGGAGLVLSKSLKINDWNGFVSHLKNLKSGALRIGHQSTGSVQSLALERALMREGIKTSGDIDDKEAKVILLDLHGPKNLIPSLSGLIVDGFVAMQPYVATAQKENAGVLVAVIEDFKDESGPGLFPCCAVAAREEFLGKNRIAAVKLVTLLMRANGYLAENPVESAPLVAKWLGVKQEVEEESLLTINYISEIDAKWIRGSKQWIREMVAGGKLKGKVKNAFLNGEEGKVIYDPELVGSRAAGGK